MLKFNVSGTQCNCSRSWETDNSQNCYREGIGFMHLIGGLWHLIEPIEIISILIMHTLICLQFRAAIQLQFDFHRAIYNLGTVLVSLWHLSCPSIMFWHCKTKYDMLESIINKKGKLEKGCVTYCLIEPKFAVWLSRGYIKNWGACDCKGGISWWVIQPICNIHCSCTCIEAQLLSKQIVFDHYL